MSISILHLSDLHRDVFEEADSDSLMFSLERDFEKFLTSTPIIQKPNICVVSGDLILGSNKKGDEAYDEIMAQYEQTKKFLIELTENFFDGKRERIIIVPGNHDIYRAKVSECVTRIPQPQTSQEIAKLRKSLHILSRGIRWSWEDLSFYQIIDQDKYNQRFLPFAEIYKDFYLGKKNYSLDPSEQWDIFDFPNFGIAIGTLNSCFNNDQFRQAGDIHPAALTNLCRAMSAPKRKGWFLAATWHHNISGPPSREDYLSSSFLPTLMETDIGLGIHGHQHSPDCFDEQYRYGHEKRKITIVSASTLCSGSHELQSGIPQSYNIIEIDPSTETGRVHQRAMRGGDIRYPSWGPGSFLQTQTSYVDFSPYLPSATRPETLDLNIVLGEAEKALTAQNWSYVIELLEKYRDNDTARAFLREALDHIDNNQKIVEIISPPADIPEAVLLGGAIVALNDKKLADEFFEYAIVNSSSDASLNYIKRSVERVKHNGQ